MSAPQSSILKDSIHTFAVRIGTALVAACLAIVTARVLGPAGRGTYMLPIVNAALAGALLSGLTNATSYYMLNKGRGKGFLQPAILSAVLLSFVGTVVVAVLALVEGRPWTIAPAAASLLPTAALAITTGYCFGIHRVRYANYITAATTVAALVLITLGFTLVSRTAAIAITMWIASLFVVGTMAAVFVLTDTRRLAAEAVALGEYLSFAVKSGLTNLLSVLNLRADVYIIAALTSPRDLGIYTVAVSGAESLKILTLVLSQTAAPRIGSASLTEAASFTAKCIRTNLIVSFIPCATIVALAPWVLALLYGSRFVTGAQPLQVLTIGIFASAPAALFSAYYTLKLGRPMVSFWNCALSAATCCALSIALIPRFGMNGAAFASTFGYVVGQCAFLRLFVKDTGLGVRTVLVVRWDDLLNVREAAQRLVHRSRNARAA